MVSPVGVRLLGGFELVRDGRTVLLPPTAQRLVAFLAMLGRPVERSFVAGSFWLDLPDRRAAANLRATVWRLNRAGCGVRATQAGHDVRAIVDGSPSHLWLDPGVAVDHRDAVSLALRLIDPRQEVDDDELDIAILESDLLPGFDADWVLLERERIRQLRLHALDALCDRLTTAGQPARAVLAGLAAVRAEPLRESAQRSLIRAHLEAGNRSEAMRQYGRFKSLLHDQLGMSPSHLMHALMGPVFAAP
ncbi:MAG: AfsR/SARP family transcriptional regulator [Acidimicrobiales bacterium]